MAAYLLFNIVFLIILMIVCSKELFLLPSAKQTLNYLMDCNFSLGFVILYLFFIVVFLPMISIINLMAFSAKNYVFTPQICSFLSFRITIRYFYNLILDFVTTFYICCCLILPKHIPYFIIRTANLGHQNHVLYIFPALLLLNLIFYTFFYLLCIYMVVIKELHSKYSTNYIISRQFLKKNHPFICTIICQLLVYLMILFKLGFAVSQKATYGVSVALLREAFMIINLKFLICMESGQDYMFGMV